MDFVSLFPGGSPGSLVQGVSFLCVFKRMGDGPLYLACELVCVHEGGGTDCTFSGCGSQKVAWQSD